jgi:hypothetical protein
MGDHNGSGNMRSGDRSGSGSSMNSDGSRHTRGMGPGTNIECGFLV